MGNLVSCPPSSGISQPPSPLGSSKTILQHPCMGWAGGCCLQRAKERAGGPLNWNKSHSQLYVPVFPVDRVPNHHQKQRQHPEYLPSCMSRGGGREKNTVKLVPCGLDDGMWGYPGRSRIAQLSPGSSRAQLARSPPSERSQGGFVPDPKASVSLPPAQCASKATQEHTFLQVPPPHLIPQSPSATVCPSADSNNPTMTPQYSITQLEPQQSGIRPHPKPNFHMQIPLKPPIPG